MSRGVPRGRANPLAGVGPRRRKSPVEGRSARRGLRAAPAAAGAGAGPEREPPEPSGAQASRARASLRARPADHERPVLGEQPRRGARRAARLSPSRGEPGHRAPRGEVSLCRAPRGGAVSPGAPPPPRPPGRTVWEVCWRNLGAKLRQRSPCPRQSWPLGGGSGRSGDPACALGALGTGWDSRESREVALSDVRRASISAFCS